MTLKRISTLLLFFIATSSVAQVTVSGFVPVTGEVGSIVTISGTNFSSTPSDNLVMFGAAVATVTNATSTTLTVKVPRGASTAPVSVMTAGFITYSSLAFTPLSVTCNSALLGSLFDTVKSFTSGRGSWGIAVGDLDADGKLDVAYPNYRNNNNGQGTTFTVHKNSSEVGNIDFLPGVNYVSGANPDDIIMNDFDNDGKPDVIVVNNDFNNTLAIFRNISTVGNIQFAPRQVIALGIAASKLNFGDFDKNGKNDLIVSYTSSSDIRIFKNVSSPGNIQFVADLIIPYDGGYSAIGDLDDDGLADIAICGSFVNTLSVYKNISTPAGIAFAAPIVLATGVRPMGLKIKDMDNDGKPDLLNVHLTDSLVSIFRNTSSGTLSFASRFDYRITPSFSYAVIANDFDGDAKPDIILTANGLGLIKNISTPGNFSFEPIVRMPATSPVVIVNNDFDNDGREDLISMVGSGLKFFTIRNKVCEQVTLCPGSSGSITSNIVGNTYVWQLDTGTGFVNLPGNTNYAGVESRTLQLNNMPSAFYGYKFRCLVDGLPTSPVLLKFLATWNGSVNNSWENPSNWDCNGLPDANTDVNIPAGNVLVNVSTSINSLSVGVAANVNLAPGTALTVSP